MAEAEDERRNGRAAAEALGSSLTMERVAAAKKFIENHYKNQRKNIEQRKERRWVLEKKLASSHVSQEEQINLIKDLEQKETEFMRLKRHKICVDDFEQLTIIGRGSSAEMLLTPQDLSFVGYTFKKFDAVKGSHHSFDMKRSTSPKRPSIDSNFGDSVRDPRRKSAMDIDTHMVSSGDAMSP